MSEHNYQPNSHKFREEQKEAERRVDKVIAGNVKTRNNDMRKFASTFISEDAKDLKSYILMDVLAPMIKNAIVDGVTTAINIIFYGRTGTRKTTSANSAYVSYRDISTRNGGRSYVSDNTSTLSRTNYNTDEFVFDSRADAAEILAQMDAIVERYGMVRVLDLYDMVGKTCDHTANKYGWTSTRDAQIVPVRGGYVIKMPRALPID